MKPTLSQLAAWLLAPLAALLVVNAPLCEAGLLTSFTDDFDRAEVGQNYATARGAAFAIGEGQVLTNGGAGPEQTYLTLGTLPTAEDYANGSMFTASIDLFIPASGQASVMTAGLLLNEQDLKGGTANRLIRFRGYDANHCSLQLCGGPWEESVDMGALRNSTWHTLKVSSTEPGVYRYVFSERGSSKPILSGRFVQTAPRSSLAGMSVFTRRTRRQELIGSTTSRCGSESARLLPAKDCCSSPISRTLPMPGARSTSAPVPCNASAHARIRALN